MCLAQSRHGDVRYRAHGRDRSDERCERGPFARRIESVKSALCEIRDTRGEVETKQVREPEYIIADTASIRVMRGNRYIRLVIQ
jgi:hypothetical protein